MTILKGAGVLTVLLFIALVDAYACGCETYREPRKDAREYYTEQFGGAIFTGTVVSIKHDPKHDEGGITYSDLIVNVNQYWLGVTKPTLVLKVSGPNTSCWLDWKVGEEHFFVVKNSHGALYYAYCDRLNWTPFIASKSELVEYTTNLLGKKPRSFPKPK